MNAERARASRGRSRRSRAALVSFALAFVLGQAAFRGALAWRPSWGDPAFGRKLDDLRAGLDAHPGRPLLLMLGSSRVATGFRPDALPGLVDGEGRAPFAFNFAQVGTGPQVAHLVLKRLLDRGIRPETVLIEFWPPFWGVDTYLPGLLDTINLAALDGSSERLLAGYLPRPRKFRADWLAAQVAPIHASRSAILSRLGPSWAPGFDPEHRLDHLDRLGWWSPRAEVPDADRRRLVDHYRGVYAPRLASFRVHPTPDRALRELLSLCRREGIRAAVVVLPESTDFRALYPPESLARVDAYLASIGREAPVIDARDWVADRDFGDGHHLLPPGAATFTTRLARESLKILGLDSTPTTLALPDRPSAVR